MQHLENCTPHNLAACVNVCKEQKIPPTSALLKELWCQLRKIPSCSLASNHFDKTIVWAEKVVNYISKSPLKIKVILYGSALYPKELYAINDPPWILYVRGENLMEVFELPWVAVVGTRLPSDSLNTEAVPICEFLVRKKLVIVSGLALGCDALAHQVAIRNHFPTVAILPTYINCIYPEKHQKLANQILEKGGLLVSEYPPLENFISRSLRLPSYNFIQRNRLIVALSKLLLVLQSSLQGGTLSTVKFAIKYRRPFCALVPSKEVISQEAIFWEANLFLVDKMKARTIGSVGEMEVYWNELIRSSFQTERQTFHWQQGGLF
ncbi:MAG: DNA-processing protein DprA [Bacteroidia bacterium]|nr:DNA-protecting protein DprA [Bacteroidia bacterium]MDW8158584.1 DNA-processing protein DprA [Bacteroidia bacterium]